MKNFSKVQEWALLERLSEVRADQTSAYLVVDYNVLVKKIRVLEQFRRAHYLRDGARREGIKEALADIKARKEVLRDEVTVLLNKAESYLAELDEREALETDEQLVAAFLQSSLFPATLPVLPLTRKYWGEAVLPPPPSQ
jgi:hypothetical protein